ncbi:MAG: molybdenum cofactor guanylyltransferase [Nitrososphaerales archaeon]
MSKKRAAIILAGGSSSRMGRNKALLILGKSTMLDHIIRRVRRVANEVVVVVESLDDQLAYKRSIQEDVPIVQDRIQKKSPLVGIVTGLENISASYVSIHPCDTPLIEPDLVNFLFRSADGHDAVIPISPDGIMQPLNAVYASENALRASIDALNAGELRCKNMIGRLDNVAYISSDQLRSLDPEFRTFLNINTSEDFQRLVRLEGAFER